MIKIKLIKEIRDADEIDDFQQRVQAVMSTWDDTPEGKKHKSDLERALASSDDMQELFHKKKKPSKGPAAEPAGEFIGEETINEAINIPFNENDNVVVYCDTIESAAQRMKKTLTAPNHNAIPYSVNDVGEGPERVDRAIQQEMARIGRQLQIINKKLFGQS